MRTVYRTIYNPGVTPVVVNRETGRTLGGGEWGTVNTTDPGVSEALDAGYIVFVEGKPAEGQNPVAREALEQTVEFRGRADRIGNLNKAALLALARRANLVGEDEEPNRDVLERLLVESDADLQPPHPPEPVRPEPPERRPEPERPTPPPAKKTTAAPKKKSD